LKRVSEKVLAFFVLPGNGIAVFLSALYGCFKVIFMNCSQYSGIYVL